MESKDVWIRGQKEEVRVFHWKHDHAGGKVSALSHVKEMLILSNKLKRCFNLV